MSETEPKEAEKLTGDALTIAFLKANLADLRTGGIVTVAMTNTNVLSYMEHWEGRAERAEARVEAQEARIQELEAALRKIETWFGEFPETGEFWHDEHGEDTSRPMSYSACYGSNGERDFMRDVARRALSHISANEAEK